MPENNSTTYHDRKRLDLTGQQFGLLTVLRLTDKRKGKIFWECICECGKVHFASTDKLRAGLRSCGCQKGSYRHGMHKTRVYSAWRAMLQRCRNPKEANYHNYGGRGIKVCQRWYVFENFYEDMGDPPPRYSIERIDNNGNYEPENCKWIPLPLQHRNKRSNRIITLDGLSLTIVEWSERTGVRQKTIGERLNRYGWSERDAIMTPTIRR